MAKCQYCNQETKSNMCQACREAANQIELSECLECGGERELEQVEVPDSTLFSGFITCQECGNEEFFEATRQPSASEIKQDLAFAAQLERLTSNGVRGQCQICGKTISDERLTCSTKCRKRKERAKTWLPTIAKQYKQFTSQELVTLSQFAGQHGIKLGSLVARALEATKDRTTTWADPCGWCGDETGGYGERTYCGTACRVSAYRLRARVGEKPDNWYLWLRDACDEKEWLRKRTKKGWGIISAIEWRYGFGVALEVAKFCYQNRGEEVGFTVSW